jgi:uncharacterized protein (TIGR00251 family)
MRDRQRPARVKTQVKNGSTPLVIHVRYCRATFLYEGTPMPDIADALLEDRHGTIISLEVIPGSKTDSFPSGYNEWRKTISCRVTAPAVEGKANRAIITLVSEKLAVPSSRVRIQSGAASSQKRVLVEGMNKKDLLVRIRDLPSS